MTNNALYFYRKIRDYLNIYLPNQRGASPNTIKAYREALNAFIDYNVSQSGNEITMHLTYKSLDNKDNITTMSEMGLFKLGGNKTEAGNGDYIALKKTLKDLQKSGYVLEEN